MDVLVWVVSGLLAVAFLAAGALKLTQPREALVAKGQAYAQDLAPATLKGIGLAEALGAVGLVLPWALDVAPVLTPLAATGLAVTMAGAVVVHVRRGDRPKELVPAAVLGLLSLFVAVARFGQL